MNIISIHVAGFVYTLIEIMLKIVHHALEEIYNQKYRIQSRLI